MAQIESSPNIVEITGEEDEEKKQEKDAQVSEPEVDTPERRLCAAVAANNFQLVFSLVNETNINCLDANGMSPLQHACFKGNLEMADFLVDRGANVNQNDHQYRYTALMFAALGGHVSCINLLLEHGARTDLKNTVGRNAAQMAGFVGQHRSVATINNFVARENIDYYAKLQPLEEEPKLPMRYVTPIHLLVRMVNMHPLRIFYFLKINQYVFEEIKKVLSVLELLSEKLLKSHEPQEMLSMKVHIIRFMIAYINKQYQESGGSESIDTILDRNIKFILKLNDKNFNENLERFLRESIREYPYTENTLFIQYVQSLSTVEIGDEPNALTILQQTIGGKCEEGSACSACAEFDPKKRCSRCKAVNYCDEQCQRYHWFVHKRHCRPQM